MHGNRAEDVLENTPVLNARQMNIRSLDSSTGRDNNKVLLSSHALPRHSKSHLTKI